MSFMDYFRSSTAVQPKSTATLAKERLKIIVAHERCHGNAPVYLPQMRQDILDVIRKYVTVTDDQVSVNLDQDTNDLSVLELNITLPDNK
jgi:cell division topological specificity factor